MTYANEPLYTSFPTSDSLKHSLELVTTKIIFALFQICSTFPFSFQLSTIAHTIKMKERDDQLNDMLRLVPCCRQREVSSTMIIKVTLKIPRNLPP